MLARLALLFVAVGDRKKYSREFVTPVAQYARVAETEEAHQKRLSGWSRIEVEVEPIAA